jgi:iron(III) transport system ATP-binding protein
MTNAIWQLQHITLKGDIANRLDDLTLTITSGVTAVVGHSGAGKTSLLNLLAGMEQPTGGSVRRLPAERTRTDVPCSPDSQGPDSFSLPLFWAPQDGGLWPHLTVIGHLTAVFEPNSLKSGLSQQDSADFLDNLLGQFDLNHRRDAFPGKLSKGEQSRLAVCRALAANPAVLIMDEPLAHVDPIRRPVYWELIRRHLQTAGASLVFSTHEPDVAVRESEFVICLQEGKIVHSGATQELYQHPPNKSAAEFLGPINWFDAAEESCWLSENHAAGNHVAVRPENLQLQVDENADIEILSFQFCGGYSESHLKHIPTSSEKTIVHRPPGSIHAAGQRVRIKVLS